MGDAVDAIYRSVEYMEAHLDCELTIAQVADVSGYSLFHFIRMFNRIVQHTPYDYLMRRRLSEAARELVESSRRIADISQDYGFSNQESFSRAFRRMFGMQPSQWRELKLDVAILRMPPLSLDDLRFRSREVFEVPEVVTLEEMEFHGLMAPGGDADPAQRSRVVADLSALGRVNARRAEITTYLDANHRRAYFFAGLAREDLLPGSPPLAAQPIPPGRYARMRIDINDLRLALNYLYFTWFPKAGCRATSPQEIVFHSAQGSELCIPVDSLEE